MRDLMKKNIIIFLVLLLCTCFSACSNSGEKSEVGSANGNTQENFRNGSWVVEYDDWSYIAYGNAIYKMQDDGSALEKIFESSYYNPKYLNIIDGSIYFQCGGIVKMKLDGSNAEVIFDENYDIVNGDYHSYSGMYATKGYLYLGIEKRISLDDYSVTPITPLDIESSTINFVDDKIYFYNSDTNELQSIGNGVDSNEGRNVIMSLFDDVSSMTTCSEKFYVISDYGQQLHTITMDGTSTEKISSGSRVSTPMIIENDLIYCNHYDSAIPFNTDNALAVLSLDGELKETIDKDVSASRLNSTENWLYYQSKSDGACYRWNKSTKEIQSLDFSKAGEGKHLQDHEQLFFKTSYTFGKLEKVKLENDTLIIKGELSYADENGNYTPLKEREFSFELHNQLTYNGETKDSWLWNNFVEEIQNKENTSAQGGYINVINGKIVSLYTAG